MRLAAPTLAAALLMSAASAVQAKLPPPSPEAKAKAAEAAAKSAWDGKVANYQLCKSMDKVAAHYVADQKKAGKAVAPTATAPCADPGPFAYVPPDQKPLEAAGAHSPAATAASPPSNAKTSAELAPAKKKP